mgnify:CR=1 FL=1
MLEVQNLSRPEGFTEVYMPDIDLNILKKQMKGINPQLANEVDSGNVTLSLREPTQTLLGAIVLEISSIDQRLDMALGTFSRLPKGFGKTKRDAGIKIEDGKLYLAVNVEEYEPSAFKKQVTYSADNLAA